MYISRTIAHYHYYGGKIWGKSERDESSRRVAAAPLQYSAPHIPHISACTPKFRSAYILQHDRACGTVAHWLVANNRASSESLLKPGPARCVEELKCTSYSCIHTHKHANFRGRSLWVLFVHLRLSSTPNTIALVNGAWFGEPHLAPGAIQTPLLGHVCV